MVDKIIAEYLKTGRRLIVPDLGVFIKREDKDEVVFSTLLTRNDGILLQMIQDRIHMPEEKAVIILNHYVKEINNQLDAIGKFRMEEFGTLIKRGDDIEFIYSGDKNVEIAYRQRRVESAQTIKMQQPVSQRITPSTQQPSNQSEDSAIIRSNQTAQIVRQQTEPETIKREQEKKETPEDSIRQEQEPVKEEAYNKPRPTAPRPKPPIKGSKNKSAKENKADIVLIAAIIAAVIAIGIIIYGATVHHPKEFNLDQQDTEQVFDMAAPEAESGK